MYRLSRLQHHHVSCLFVCFLTNNRTERKEWRTIPSCIEVILPLHEGAYSTISKYASCLIGECVWFSPGMNKGLLKIHSTKYTKQDKTVYFYTIFDLWRNLCFHLYMCVTGGILSKKNKMFHIYRVSSLKTGHVPLRKCIVSYGGTISTLCLWMTISGGGSS